MARLIDYDSVRSQRIRRKLFIARQLYPARLFIRLQREESRLMMDFDGAPDAAGRIALVSPLAKVRGQILDIIGVPKRPGSPAVKSQAISASGHGQIADAVLVELDSNPDQIPAQPAVSQE